MTSEPKQKFDPLADVKEFVMGIYTTGKLPVVILGFVVVYNFIFFSFPPGYGLYAAIPTIGVVILSFSSYWEDRNNRGKVLRFGALLIFIALFDGLVSLSYMWGLPLANRGVPTFVADIIAILTFIAWYKGWKVPPQMVEGDPITIIEG